MIEEIRIPEISENVTTGQVVKVLVKEGDMVAVDDILIEFETEKALVEIPATVAGKIVALLAKVGQEMKVGDLIAKVETEVRAPAPEDGKAEPSGTDKPPDGDRRVEPEAPGEDEAAGVAAEAVTEPVKGKSRDTASKPASRSEPRKEEEAAAEPVAEKRRRLVAAAPSVRRFARELGVDVHQVMGTGPNGRITPEDVKAAVRGQRQRPEAAGGIGAGDASGALPDFSRWGKVEFHELSAVRRLTARSTATSWRTVPHVTQFDRADITPVERFIKKHAPRLEKRGVKLTLTAVVMKVCAVALARYPRFNASIDPSGDRIIDKQYIHIGVAVDTERGLLVPVVRDADRQSIDQLAAAIADLAERARTKKIKPDEMEGGTFTISNQGGIGGTQFTPIVMWPQVAILGMSRASVEPVYTDGAFAPRTMLPLALSYDHRIIDGADAARFVRFISESLEQPLTLFVSG